MGNDTMKICPRCDGIMLIDEESEVWICEDCGHEIKEK